jgi:hypothetical protein
MEEIIKALLAAGYHVEVFPGKLTENAWEDDGFTARVCTRQYMMVGVRNEYWTAHADTPDAALKLAARQIHDHMWPAYDGYLTIANRLGWEK